ncbi:hypothetical protein EUGRSUZ_K00282 [Eucalyptus grandis]|uniref:Uncharacterized protein n=2 Tax=Eucalyptus grandis TaxID=71139 RepID=A0ACC3IQ04_EUCGR|nr:hypothetical protein EUGRSUZ_K00282 [Eucalyptus grandis]
MKRPTSDTKESPNCETFSSVFKKRSNLKSSVSEIGMHSCNLPFYYSQQVKDFSNDTTKVLELLIKS